MSDLISRQKVLNTLDFADNALTDEERTVEKYKELLTECVKVLPPAKNDGDLISRQAAIDAIENAFDRETILNRFVRKIAISAVRLLPSAQPEQRWIPCSEKEAEYPCLACDVFGQIFITNNGIVRINGECYDGTGFDFSNAEEFLKGIKVGNSMRMLPRKIVAWSPLPEPYKGGEDE